MAVLLEVGWVLMHHMRRRSLMASLTAFRRDPSDEMTSGCRKMSVHMIILYLISWYKYFGDEP